MTSLRWLSYRTVTLIVKSCGPEHRLTTVSDVSPFDVVNAISDDASQKITQFPADLITAERYCPHIVPRTNERCRTIVPRKVSPPPCS
ncbi:MAG TPA: hypothetical protein VGI80_04890 [Pyrinomonadaceae bacterium]